MVRYLAGEVRIPPDSIDRVLRAFSEYLDARPGDGERELPLTAVVQWIVERTMVPQGQVERTLTAMFALSARLDDALGPDGPGGGES
jgi:hypothetical protein